MEKYAADGRSIPADFKYVLVYFTYLNDGDRANDETGIIVPAPSLFAENADLDQILDHAFRAEAVSEWHEPSKSSTTKRWIDDFHYPIIEKHMEAVRSGEEAADERR
jgi:hypothetical protein